VDVKGLETLQLRKIHQLHHCACSSLDPAEGEPCLCCQAASPPPLAQKHRVAVHLMLSGELGKRRSEAGSPMMRRCHCGASWTTAPTAGGMLRSMSNGIMPSMMDFAFPAPTIYQILKSLIGIHFYSDPLQV
jgi:hypothetical protein